jgi:hypothetical protein
MRALASLQGQLWVRNLHVLRKHVHCTRASRESFLGGVLLPMAAAPPDLGANRWGQLRALPCAIPPLLESRWLQAASAFDCRRVAVSGMHICCCAQPPASLVLPGASSWPSTQRSAPLLFGLKAAAAFCLQVRRYDEIQLPSEDQLVRRLKVCASQRLEHKQLVCSESMQDSLHRHHPSHCQFVNQHLKH